MSEPTATIYEFDKKLVLDDLGAQGAMRAVAKYNCGILFNDSRERILHFARRMGERGLSSEQAVIVLLNVDDVHGGPIAEALMPGHSWQEYRDRGETPIARGIAMREGVEAVLDEFDKHAAAKLRAATKDIVVVVVDQGVAEVFKADQGEP